MHHFCTLAGYGAEAINPYLAFETLVACMPTASRKRWTIDEVVHRYIKSVDKGILKVMSKMGISTYQSYCGAQIFDAVGLSSEFVDKYFFGTATPSKASASRGRRGDRTPSCLGLRRRSGAAAHARVGGEYAYRIRGEAHMWSPDTVAQLQHAVRTEESTETYRRALFAPGRTKRRPLRRSWHVPPQGRRRRIGRAPVPHRRGRAGQGDRQALRDRRHVVRLDLREAHTTLAIAMNRIGGRSNTGEGGEEPDRFKPLPERRIRCARRSSRSPPAASASPPSIWSTPTRSRSRWRRARSPAKAASCPATRSTRRSPRCAIRRQASA
jgi:glutamate synthase (NADPH/NADH) large chain